MAIKKFKIQNVKALGLAECELLPKVMIIAGPNGAGKSTLLYEISQKRQGVEIEGLTKILYQPPHRAIRRTSVQRSWLGGGIKSLLDLISSGNIDGYQGLSFQNTSRTPDNIDEAGSTIKHTLGKIENKRQSSLTKFLDNSRESSAMIKASEISDIYEPLKELTKYLLPHLKFERVDFNNEDNIKCVWKRTDKSGYTEIDIDDMSSGEKSIIILFLPLIESEIHENLKKIENSINSDENIDQDLVLVIDEPELHLHPDLQSKILSYIRFLSIKKNIQFIISTHSTTILDQAYDDELYLLTQRNDVDGTQNQLRKIASSIEKLEALKQLAGNAYFITTGRSIVCIEGEPPDDNKVTDIRLLEILYPRSTAYTFVPSGGKANVINTVKRLRLYLNEENFNIAVYGLTDKDQGQSIENIDGVFCLPVCMIENLLLIPESISEYLRSKDVNKSSEVVKEILNLIVNDIIEQEISLRISKKLKAKTIRIVGNSKEEIKISLENQIQEMRVTIPDDDSLDILITEIKTEVNNIVSNNKALEYFRGKVILKNFYNQEINSLGVSYSNFCYELAQLISKNQSLGDLLNPIFDKMK